MSIPRTVKMIYQQKKCINHLQWSENILQPTRFKFKIKFIKFPRGGRPVWALNWFSIYIYLNQLHTKLTLNRFDKVNSVCNICIHTAHTVQLYLSNWIFPFNLISNTFSSFNGINVMKINSNIGCTFHCFYNVDTSWYLPQVVYEKD